MVIIPSSSSSSLSLLSSSSLFKFKINCVDMQAKARTMSVVSTFLKFKNWRTVMGEIRYLELVHKPLKVNFVDYIRRDF